MSKKRLFFKKIVKKNQNWNKTNFGWGDSKDGEVVVEFIQEQSNE